MATKAGRSAKSCSRKVFLRQPAVPHETGSPYTLIPCTFGHGQGEAYDVGFERAGVSLTGPVDGRGP